MKAYEEKNGNKTAVIIAVYNNLTHLVECLRSLEKVEGKDDIIIYIVDDMSDPKITYDKISTNNLEIKIIRTPSEMWWGGATDYGIDQALNRNPEYILLANPDVTFENSSIKKLRKLFDEKKIDVACSVVKDKKTMDIVWQGSRLIKKGPLVYLKSMRKNTGTIYPTSEFTGRGVLIKSDIFKHHKITDGGFHHYFADTDFSLRVTSCGYRAYVCSESVVYVDTTETGQKRIPSKYKITRIFKRLFLTKYGGSTNSWFRYLRRDFGYFISILSTTIITLRGITRICYDELKPKNNK